MHSWPHVPCLSEPQVALVQGMQATSASLCVKEIRERKLVEKLNLFTLL